MADDDREPEDDFQEMLRRLLGGADGPTPEQLEQLRALGVDPAMMDSIMRQLQAAFNSAPAGGISWDVAQRQALHIANQSDLGVTSGQRGEFDQAFSLAMLWLGEATTISDLGEPPRALTRGGWVEATMPVWQELAEPVATSIADALTEAMSAQAPEDMQQAIAGAGRVMRTIGGSLFATQLGQVIGRLSLEVVSGGDVGIPVMPAGQAAILPQNFADFGRDLEVPEDQLALYLATRELAHARLFRHAKWLRLHMISQVTEFARGVHVDMDALEELATRFDPEHPDELRDALSSGALLPQRSEAQTAALTRLENLLALVEGWVEVVTADATARLPLAVRIAEAVRRRRAVGGPAEKALGSLVGLELRPRRMREAAAMWRAVTDAVGPGGRDALWDYPDLMPTADDIDDPRALIDRLQARARGDQPVQDEMDEALEALLRGEDPSADESPSGEPPTDDSPDEDDRPPHGPQPV
ncbi:zinc-dependent metalloprotease [Microbacterium horticulturae]|uniref:Zinc-dependent metalloprotease n=1 Tax=Microbacterium horticulturae TaxID=3028316 RepID=A0ABY8BTJ4_9MICO|nr:zinc-dependent metalloprotease [Microbacterium sp. KACC 23027]WEG07495.1 zinc-dependent metalloprotease [Microbacterium sp. KACC 23027]